MYSHKCCRAEFLFKAFHADPGSNYLIICQIDPDIVPQAFKINDVLKQDFYKGISCVDENMVGGGKSV